VLLEQNTAPGSGAVSAAATAFEPRIERFGALDGGTTSRWQQCCFESKFGWSSEQQWSQP
jgi:hypothetical protein